MIAALMMYSITVTLLLAVAAAAAEHLLRLAKRPARAVWLLALSAAAVLCVARFASSASQRPAPSDVAPAMRISSIVVRNDTGAPREYLPISTPALQVPAGATSSIPVVRGSVITQLDRPLVVVWIALSLMGAVIFGVSTVRLSRKNRRWSSAVVDGVPVLVSHDLGPAVIGALRYHIVLPEWALTLSPAERDLILAHEREHAAAGDPLLLLFGTAMIVLMPWNAAIWWMARRLRFAIELDCDARVLRTRPDPRAYGSLLLDVSERTLGGAIPVAALAEPVSLIERRISAMTARLPRFAAIRGALSATMAIVLIVVACVAPRPRSVPAPSVDKPTPPSAQPMRDLPKDSAIESLAHAADSVLALIKTDSTLEYARALPAVDSATYEQLRGAVDSLNRQLAALERERSAWRSIDSAIAVAPVESGTSGAFARVAAGAGGAIGGAATGARGSADAAYPRVALDARTLGASVARDSANWDRVRPIAGAVVSAPPGIPNGDICGRTSNDAAGVFDTRDVGRATAPTTPGELRLDYRVRPAFDQVVKSCPRAFGSHEGTLYVFVFLLDSTAHVTNMSISARRAMGPDDVIHDREVLKMGMPDVSIASLYEWGLTDVSTPEQQRGSGVLVMYGFTAKPR
jgi:beta-lactamase regulating signal transducer with metallopeptidase domain